MCLRLHEALFSEYRTNRLATWVNEQPIREIHLKPFHAEVVKYGRLSNADYGHITSGPSAE